MNPMIRKHFIVLILFTSISHLSQATPPICRCSQCYDGYTLQNDRCVVPICNKTILRGCSSWNPETYQCFSCIAGWYYSDTENACLPVSPLCRTSDLKGRCTSCYNIYYYLSDGNCIFNGNLQIMPLGCSYWLADLKICLSCFPNLYLRNMKECLQVSPLCKKYDEYGNCISCIDGYQFEANGQCMISACKPNLPVGCRSMVFQVQLKISYCIECEVGWHLNNHNVCIQVCNCKECYYHYYRDGDLGQCFSVLSPFPDLSCKYWDWDNQVCSKCLDGFFIGMNGHCQPLTTANCLNFNKNNKCTNCQVGYILYKEQCWDFQTLHCKVWDQTINGCYQCLQNYYVDIFGICKQKKSILCWTYNEDGSCSKCFQSYHLTKSFQCLKTNRNCQEFVFDENRCIKCKKEFYINAQGFCSLLNCKTFDNYSGCHDCFKGYKLKFWNGLFYCEQQVLN